MVTIGTSSQTEYFTSFNSRFAGAQHNKQGELLWKNTFLQNCRALRGAFEESLTQLKEHLPEASTVALEKHCFEVETSLKKHRVLNGEKGEVVSPAQCLLEKAGLPIPVNFPDSMWHIYKAAVLRSWMTWRAVEKLCEAYEKGTLYHPAAAAVKEKLSNLPKTGRLSAKIRKIASECEPKVPRPFLKIWCEALGIDQNVHGIYLDPADREDRKDIKQDFITELTSLSHEYWTDIEVSPNWLRMKKLALLSTHIFT